MNAPALPNRLSRFFLYFARQFLWGCLGLLVFPVLGRAVFASIAYATKQLTDTVLAMHDPAADAGPALRAPFTLFVALVAARFVCDAAMWFCSYHTRSPMLVRIKEEVFAYAQRLSPARISRTRCPGRSRIGPSVARPGAGAVRHDGVRLRSRARCFFVFVAAYFYVASPVFCAAAVCGIVVYFTVSLLVGRECARRAIANNEASAAVTGRIVDVITNIRNVFFFANQSARGSRS